MVNEGVTPPWYSVRARKRLEPLVTALEARPGRDAQDLARMTRQVASARV